MRIDFFLRLGRLSMVLNGARARCGERVLVNYSPLRSVEGREAARRRSMRTFRHFNAPAEKSFTVVYWDQRGTGKSFDRNIPDPP